MKPHGPNPANGKCRCHTRRLPEVLVEVRRAQPRTAPQYRGKRNYWAARVVRCRQCGTEWTETEAPEDWCGAWVGALGRMLCDLRREAEAKAKRLDLTPPDWPPS